MQPFADGQPGWRWCRLCKILFFSGRGNPGACPNNVNGFIHDATGSGQYFVGGTAGPTGIGADQSGWHCCNKCNAMFFAGNRHPDGSPFLGACPPMAADMTL